MDKLEITDQAQRIGTFDVNRAGSRLLFTLRSAASSTKTRIDDIRRIERSLDIGALVKQGLDKVEVSELLFRLGRTGARLLLHDPVRVEFSPGRQGHQPVRRWNRWRP